MAVLNPADRAAVVAEISRELSASRTVFTLTRAQLRAAVDATDQWIDDNAASYNTAIPQPARGVLTAKQKADLFMRVALRRFSVTA